MFRSFERLIKSVFPSSMNPRTCFEEATTTDPNLSKKKNVKQLKKAIISSMKNEKSQHELIQGMFEAMRMGRMELSTILDFFLPVLEKFPYKETSSCTIMDFMNHCLFRFSSVNTEQIDGYLSCLSRFVRELGEWTETPNMREDVNERQQRLAIQELRVKHLVRIYFGILYISCSNPVYELRCKSLKIFNEVLRILEPSLTDMETTFHFSEKKNFMKVVMRYKRRTLFISEENIFSSFYFKLISQLQNIYQKDEELKSEIPNALEWSEGSLLSVYGSIRQDRIFVLTEEDYLQALSEIVMRKGENYILALFVIKRVCGLSEYCDRYFKKYFEKKRGIELNKIFGYLDDKYTDDVFNYSPLGMNNEEIIKNCLVQRNLGFKNNLFKCRSFGLCVKTQCEN